MAKPTDDTRRRLLEAAGETFAEKGFQAATVREICSRAEANLAAVNYHFGDKEQLYLETVRYAHFAGQGPPSSPPPSSATPEQRLREFIYDFLSRLLDPNRPAWHARLIAREMSDPSARCLEMMAPYVRANFTALQAVLDDLLAQETPEVERHLIGFSIVGQCLHFKMHRPIARLLVGEEELATYDLDRIADHITRFSLASLGRTEPSPLDSEAAAR